MIQKDTHNSKIIHCFVEGCGFLPNKIIFTFCTDNILFYHQKKYNRWNKSESVIYNKFKSLDKNTNTHPYI